MGGVEGFIRPHEHDRVFPPDVFDGVCVSGWDVDDFHALFGAGV